MPSIWTRLAFSRFGKGLTLSQIRPGFYVSALELFLKILWEKEKLLVTSNFSFSNSVFFPFGELSVTFITVKIVVCKSLLVGMSLKFVVWERVKPFPNKAWFLSDCITSLLIGWLYWGLSLL